MMPPPGSMCYHRRSAAKLLVDRFELNRAASHSLQVSKGPQLGYLLQLATSHTGMVRTFNSHVFQVFCKAHCWVTYCSLHFGTLGCRPSNATAFEASIRPTAGLLTAASILGRWGPSLQIPKPASLLRAQSWVTHCS